MKLIDKLHAYWNKKENDLGIHWPGGIGTKSDGHWLSGLFTDSVQKELVSRGYDITTLKFSIEPMKCNQKFTSQNNPEE